MLMTTEVAVNDDLIIVHLPTAKGSRTNVTVISPPTGHKYPITETVRHPEELLNYPGEHESKTLVEECNQKQRPCHRKIRSLIEGVCKQGPPYWPNVPILLVENAGTIFENMRHGPVMFYKRAK